MSFSARALRVFLVSCGYRPTLSASGSCLAILLAIASPSIAQDAPGVSGGANAVALKVGALGLGVEYTRAFGDRIALRGAFYGSNYGTDSEESDIEYQIDLVWDSFSVGIDLHPGRGPFRLSVGYMSNENRLEAVSTPTGNETIGDTVYTPAQIGTLNGLVTFDDSAAYAGLGWDWSRDKDGFGMSFDLGLVSQGAPNAEFNASGTAASNPGFQNDLRNEEVQIEEDLDGLDLVPFATLGFNFRF